MKLKVKRFKRMWMVITDLGYTLANCNSENEAKEMKGYLEKVVSPSSVIDLGQDRISRKERTIKKIQIYP